MTDFNYKVIGKQAELSERIQFLETQDRTLKYVRRTMLPRGTIGSDSYTVSPYDTYIGWCGGTVSKGGTIQFEAPGTVGGNAGRLVIIKDEVGSAASFPILIEGTSAQTFDGIGSVALKVNFGAIGVVSNGTTWQVAFRDPPESFGSARFNDGVRMGGTSGLVVGGTTTSVAGSTGYFMGSVGIGTVPAYRLDVAGAGVFAPNSNGVVAISTPASHNGFILTSNDANVYRGDILRSGTAIEMGCHANTTAPTRTMRLDNSGNLHLPNIQFTSEGGIAYLMTNLTGSATTQGLVVEASATANSFINCGVGKPDPIGIVYSGGVADGGLCWVVIGGRAAVYFANAATIGYFARMTAAGDTGASAGVAICEAVPTAPFYTDKHFQEIGHIIGGVGADNLGTVLLHWN